MDLKSAVQTVKPIEMNVKWWKDNVREKMFSLNILENAVKGSGPIFRKKLPFLSESHHFWSKNDSNQVFKLDFKYGTIWGDLNFLIARESATYCMRRLNSRVFKIFDPREWNLNLNSLRRSQLMKIFELQKSFTKNTEHEPIFWEPKREKTLLRGRFDPFFAN